MKTPKISLAFSWCVCECVSPQLQLGMPVSFPLWVLIPCATKRPGTGQDHCGYISKMSNQTLATSTLKMATLSNFHFRWTSIVNFHFTNSNFDFQNVSFIFGFVFQTGLCLLSTFHFTNANFSFQNVSFITFWMYLSFSDLSFRWIFVIVTMVSIGR